MIYPWLTYTLLVLALVELASIAYLLARLRYTQGTLSGITRNIEEVAEARARSIADEMIKEAREDAIRRSSAALSGRIYEQLVPFMPWFRYNPREARFLGSPVDFVVFDGIDEGNLRSIVFVEVKKGSSKMSDRERLVKEAVERCAVRFELVKVDQRPST